MPALPRRLGECPSVAAAWLVPPAVDCIRLAWSRNSLLLPCPSPSPLVHFPNLTLADITRDVARRAAQLRARHDLRPADALQVASALVHEATAFVTNDRRLRRIAHEIDIIVLSDYQPEAG